MPGDIRLDDLGEGIVRLTIDHQERLNALNNAMWDLLGGHLRDINADESVRCIVITGAGDKAFAVGADISEFEENRSSVEKARVYARRTHGALAALSECRHPVIAAINGLCVGGGLEIACCADLRIASDSSRFGIPVKRLGLVVAYDEMRALLHLVGKSNTLRILLEGDVFEAGEALRMGLVNRVVPAAEFDAAVMKSASLIAEGAPLVARWHKKFANRLMNPASLTPEEKDESFTCFGTEDFATGYQAFLEKRQPRFAGR
jgi:enoyl-CoA hydratase